MQALLPILNDSRFPYWLLAGAIFLLAVIVFLHHRRIEKLVRGKDGGSLEDMIVALGEELLAIRTFQDQSEEYFALVETRLRRSIQAVETLRFNPWKGSGEGGNQSFATAFLNEHGDGVVFSSLHSRDRVSVFSKPVKKNESEFELSEEEVEAIAQAKKILASIHQK